MSNIEVPAYQIKQGGWTLYGFVIDADRLDRIAFVSRREEDKDLGYQRNLSKTRAAEIADYLHHHKGCIPNSILVSLDSGASFDANRGVLCIPDAPKTAWLIDGQHRMFGLRQSKLNFEVFVTAFVGLSTEDQAKQFKTINSKQKGVPTSLLYDLLDLTKDGTYVQQRGHELATRLNEDPESPFYEQIDMTGSSHGLITQTRVVTALEGMISEKGALYQYSEEEQYGILRNYFSALKALLPSDWGNKQSVLTKAIGFSALLTVLPQVLNLCLLRSGDFTVHSVLRVLEPLRAYSFSSEAHKGWAGHPGENRLAAVLAERLKQNSPGTQTSGTGLRLT